MRRDARAETEAMSSFLSSKGVPMFSRRGTLAVVCLATAMLMLDIAVVNTALPKIASDLEKPNGITILDAADIILTMLSLEITSIKNMRLFLEVAEQLGYEKGKVRLVLNRADSALGIRVADVEHSIGRKVDETVVSDGRSVVYALNRGVPFFLSNREAQVSQDILRLARSVVGGQSQTDTVDAGKSTQKKSLFAWR